MKKGSNLTNFSANKLDPQNMGKLMVHEPSSHPISINELSLSPVSDENVPRFRENSFRSSQEEQRGNNENFNKVPQREKTPNSSKADLLPKINNPRAENRLKTLMILFGKKNARISGTKLSPYLLKKYKYSQDSSSDERRKEKQNLILPSINSLGPNQREKKDQEHIKKKVIKFPQGNFIIKVRPEAAESKMNEKTEKNTEPFVKQPQLKLGRDLSVPVETKKRVVFSNYSRDRSTEEKNISLMSGESPTLDKMNSQRRRKEKKTVPEPYLDFDSRIHRVSVDDAIERLIQLTNQSGNARKDLLKIQENALAIKLRNEKILKGLKQINSERDIRNH
jgi:hypothetical protein